MLPHPSLSFFFHFTSSILRKKKKKFKNKCSFEKMIRNFNKTLMALIFKRPRRVLKNLSISSGCLSSRDIGPTCASKPLLQLHAISWLHGCSFFKSICPLERERERKTAFTMKFLSYFTVGSRTSYVFDWPKLWGNFFFDQVLFSRTRLQVTFAHFMNSRELSKILVFNARLNLFEKYFSVHPTLIGALILPNEHRN